LHQAWLNRPFFLVRAVSYLAIWIAFSVLAIQHSRRKVNDDLRSTASSKRRAAVFLVLFGITCWLSSYDWLMSLEPEWTSTVFGVYHFAGLISSGYAGIILLVICLGSVASRRFAVSKNQLQDLGTLLFGFSCFWMYIWFCQYLLIWYVNNPEEAAYYRLRQHETWPVWMYLDLILNWGIPFAVLLFRPAKRSAFILGTVAAVVLVGRWVDLSVMVLPSQADGEGALDLLGAGQALGATAFGVLVVLAVLGKVAVSTEDGSFDSSGIPKLRVR
jgi:hypothetical protein